MRFQREIGSEQEKNLGRVIYASETIQNCKNLTGHIDTLKDFDCFLSTVEPVLSGTVLSGHPLLNGQLSKSQKLCPLIIVILTSIKRSRSPFTESQRAVSIVLTCFKQSLCKRKALKYGDKQRARQLNY